MYAPFVGHITRSAYFEYHEQSDAGLCPGLLDLLDTHARQVGGSIDLPPPSGDPFRYYHFAPAADAGIVSSISECGSPLSACALGNAVYSPYTFHQHELAHDYVFRAWGGWSDGLLDEGEAVALSCDPWAPLSLDVSNTRWQDFLNLYGDSTDGYYAAGVFVTYLATHFGWQSVAQLHEKVGPGAAAADVAAAFAEVYPMSLDEAWSTALHATGAWHCTANWICGGAPLSVGDSISPQCDGWEHRSIHMDSESLVSLWFAGTSETGYSFMGDNLVLADCSGARTEYPLLVASGAQNIHWVTLPSGDYEIWTPYTPSPSTFSLQSSVEQPLIAASCGEGPVVSLQAGVANIVDFSRSTETTGWIQIAGGGATFQVFSYQVVPLPAITICDGCTQSATCTTLSGQGPIPITIGDSAVVHLDGVFTAPPWGYIGFDGAPL